MVSKGGGRNGIILGGVQSYLVNSIGKSNTLKHEIVFLWTLIRLHFFNYPFHVCLGQLCAAYFDLKIGTGLALFSFPDTFGVTARIEWFSTIGGHRNSLQ